jgi:hypothetical protein
MEEVSAQAHVAADGVDSPLAVAVSRDEVERTLDEGQEADLVLDVVRSNGQREEQRVLVALDTEVLRHLLSQEGEQVVVGIDPESLAKAFDDVELHGLREVGATLAIAVAAVGAGAGTAAAQPEPAAAAGQSGTAYVAFQTDFPVTQATVQDQAGLIEAAGGIEQVRAEHIAAGNLAPNTRPVNSRCRVRCRPTTRRQRTTRSSFVAIQVLFPTSRQRLRPPIGASRTSGRRGPRLKRHRIHRR